MLCTRVYEFITIMLMKIQICVGGVLSKNKLTYMRFVDMPNHVVVYSISSDSFLHAMRCWSHILKKFANFSAALFRFVLVVSCACLVLSRMSFSFRVIGIHTS